MSPEQATGDDKVGPATDVYALGCVLYEMLVGEPPYTGSTPQAILGKIILAKPVSAMEARRSVPANVDAVIRRSLEKLAADRFATARDVGATLADRGFRHGEPDATGAGAGRRSALAAGIAGAVLASVFTGALAWGVASGNTEGLPALTRFALDIPGGGAFRGNAGYGGTANPIEVSRDGRELVFNTAPPGAARLSQLFVRPLETLEAAPIQGDRERRQLLPVARRSVRGLQ